MQDPKISIVVPIYNVSDYLPRLVESLKSQTAPRSEWETIFVDDCSTDNSLNLIKRLTRSERNANVISHNLNQGVSEARNSGIKNSFGRFIAQLDGDDMLEPEAIEILISFLKQNPQVKYSYSSHKRVNFRGELIQYKPSKPFNLSELFHYNFISPLKAFSRDTNEDIGGFRKVYAEDWDHPLRATKVLSPEEFGQIPESLYLYVMRPNSSIHTIPENKKRKEICDFLTPHVQDYTGKPVNVFWSHLNEDGFNYYDWEVLEHAETFSDSK
jgi:O-antigen biosynthesis protein